MCVHECIDHAGMEHGDPAWQCMLFRFAVCTWLCAFFLCMSLQAALMTAYPMFLSFCPFLCFCLLLVSESLGACVFGLHAPVTYF